MSFDVHLHETKIEMNIHPEHKLLSALRSFCSMIFGSLLALKFEVQFLIS